MVWSWLTDTTFLGNTVVRWTLALTVAVVVAVVLRVLRGLARRRLQAAAARTSNVVDDILSDVLAGVGAVFMTAVGVWAGSRVLDLAPRVANVIDTGMTLILILSAALWGNRALQVTVHHYRGIEGLDGSRRTTLAALTFLGRLALFTVLILLALDNLGIDITALLAGIGIASVGIGLALQNIMSDLFGSLSIILDKPFEIGDFIVVDEMAGTVEHVGLRTTRIRSLSGEQLVFANNDLLTSRIRNYKRMQERRVLFALGVTYQTPRDLLAGIPGIVREIVESQETVRFDRAHFQGFGDSALNFEIVYWMLEADYNLFMDVQQRINLGLMAAFEERGIEFAYPTRTLFVQREDAPPQPEPAGA